MTAGTFTFRGLRLIACSALLGAALLPAGTTAHAETGLVGAETEQIKLIPGYSRIYTLDAPASNIVVGNPNIMSVSLIDPLHVLLTPTARGTGNLLFLDGQKNIVKSLRLDIGIAQTTAGVTSRDVRIYRALSRSDYACSAIDCVPTGVPAAQVKN